MSTLAILLSAFMLSVVALLFFIWSQRAGLLERNPKGARVNDIGRVINPAIGRGQIEGAVVQGIGQALSEQIVYDAESGQLLSGSFLDYAAPRAASQC